MSYEDNVRTSVIAYLGVVCALGTLAIVMLLQVLFYDRYNALQQQELASAGPPTELAQLTAQQQTVLTQRKWVDRNTGKVTIGISTAMDLVLAELTEGKSPQAVVGPAETPAASADSEPSAPTPESAQGTEDGQPSPAVSEGATDQATDEPAAEGDRDAASATEATDNAPEDDRSVDDPAEQDNGESSVEVSNDEAVDDGAPQERSPDDGGGAISTERNDENESTQVEGGKP